MDSRHRLLDLLLPTVLWLAACFVADVDESLDAAVFVEGAAIRAVVTLVIGVVMRGLYVLRHGGRVVAPETLWIATACAAFLAAGRLFA